MNAEKTEREIMRIMELTGDELRGEILKRKESNPGWDFTEDYLRSLSKEQLQHDLYRIEEWEKENKGVLV